MPEAVPPPDATDEIIGRAFRRSLTVIITIGVIALAALGVYVTVRTPPVEQSAAGASTPPRVRARGQEAGEASHIPDVRFTDVTSSAGIRFVHHNGAEGEKLLPETMGGGCAFFDYDNDGDQDLLLVNATSWPWSTKAIGPKASATTRLYRNDGSGTFEDVSAAAGVDLRVYGMGAAAGDYDNDGWIDLFITTVGPNRLLRNVQGRFADVTAAAGVSGARDALSTCAAWLDYDSDGDLDLFVCNYVRWSRALDFEQDFRLVGIGRAYGPPRGFAGTHPYLYRNDGHGRFVDVSASAGVQVDNPSTRMPMAKSLGVAPLDVDRDGWIDLLVANDTVPNFLFRNKGDGTFEDIGARAGVAFDSYGNARGAMGIDAAHLRNDETLGIAIGNFANEMTALYLSQSGPLQFADEAIGAGVGAPSRLALTFGVLFVDYDLDGRLDLLTANGHIEDEINLVQPSQQYAQPAQLFWNAGPDAVPIYRVVPPEKAGADLFRPMVGRGAAFADIDSDGDLDVVLTAVGGAPRLLRNDLRGLESFSLEGARSEKDSRPLHWVRFVLEGTTSNRHAIGAWVEVTVGGEVRRRPVMPTRSYLSQSELPVTVGLGDATRVDSVHIVWPGGRRQRVSDVRIDGTTKVVEQN